MVRCCHTLVNDLSGKVDLGLIGDNLGTLWLFLRVGFEDQMTYRARLLLVFLVGFSSLGLRRSPGFAAQQRARLKNLRGEFQFIIWRYLSQGAWRRHGRTLLLDQLWFQTSARQRVLVLRRRGTQRPKGTESGKRISKKVARGSSGRVILILKLWYPGFFS